MPKKGFASGTRPSSKTRSLLRRCALNGQCAPAPIARVRPSHSVTSLGENGQPTERASKRSACAPAAEVQPPPTCRRSSNNAPASLPTHVARMEVELEKMREILAVYEQRDADKQHKIDPLRREDVQQTNCAAPFAEEGRRSRSRRTTASSTLRYVGRHRVVHTPLILAHALTGLPDRRLSLPRTPRREHGHVSSLTRTSSARSRSRSRRASRPV